jgi:hypothetical protein
MIAADECGAGFLIENDARQLRIRFANEVGTAISVVGEDLACQLA